MITRDVNINKFTRMRYFDGLFLQEGEFRTDQAFYLTVRRYLNYLLFEPGVLLTADPGPDITTSASLRVTEGPGLAINVAPGIGLVSDPAAEMAYEVELPAAQTFSNTDITTAGLDGSGSVIRVILHRDENDFTVSGPSNDRTVERAQVSLVAPADITTGAFSSVPHIVLATLSVNAAGTALNLDSDDRSRGGIKLAILSDGVYSMLGGGTAPGPTPVLTDFIGVDEPAGIDHVRFTGTDFVPASAATGASIEFTDTSAPGGLTTPVPVPAANVDPTEIRLDWLNATSAVAATLATAERGPFQVTIFPHGAIPSGFDFFPPPIANPLPATHSISGSPQLTITGQRFYSTSGLPQVEFVPTTGASSIAGADSGSTENSLIVTIPSTVATGSYEIRVVTRGGTIDAGNIIFIS